MSIHEMLFVALLAADLGLADGQPAPPQQLPEFIPAPIEQQPIPEIPEDAVIAEQMEALKRPPRHWARAEFLVWWIKSGTFPPLVTRGEFSDPVPGGLDSPNTQILLGGPGQDYQDRTGGRFTFGGWLDDCRDVGIEAGYFFVGGRAINRGFASPGNPVLATPFFNVNNNAVDASLITFPGIMSGFVDIDAPSFLQGAELNLDATLTGGERWRLGGIAGFRYMNLREAIHLRSFSFVDVAPQFQGFGIPFDGNTIMVSDLFRTQNHFFGGQLGARLELRHKRFTLGFDGKLALGLSHEIVTIRGFTGIDTQPATAVDAGVLAVATNSGRHVANSFAVVPEAAINLKFQLTERLAFFGGYSFLYWNRVARPGDQIDTGVNVNFVPTSATFGAAGGLPRPVFNFRHSDFFAHGANVGVEIRY